MRKLLIFVLMQIIVMSLCGCKTISVGGTGKIGNITGSGEVALPLPATNTK
jgi:hypothetical protein